MRYFRGPPSYLISQSPKSKRFHLQFDLREVCQKYFFKLDFVKSIFTAMLRYPFSETNKTFGKYRWLCSSEQNLALLIAVGLDLLNE